MEIWDDMVQLGNMNHHLECSNQCLVKCDNEHVKCPSMQIKGYFGGCRCLRNSSPLKQPADDMNIFRNTVFVQKDTEFMGANIQQSCNPHIAGDCITHPLGGVL